MNFVTTSKLIRALPILSGDVQDGKFPRWPSVGVSRATEARKRMNEILQLHFPICSEHSSRARPRPKFPCLETHLESRNDPPTEETEREAEAAGFWLSGAMVLREAQDHIGEADRVDVEGHIGISKEEVLQTFQHYILIFLAQGKLHSKPLQQFTGKYVDTCVPNLHRVRQAWEEGEAFRDILMRNDMWFCWAPEFVDAPPGYQMRWKLGIEFQMCLLVR